MPRAAILFCVLLGVAAVAQQTVNPRRRPGVPITAFGPDPITAFAPEQHDRWRGRVTLSSGRIDRWNELGPCQKAGIVGFVHAHGIDAGCGDDSWPKTLLYLPGWGFGHATVHGQPLPENYEMHFTVTQGGRDREH